MNLVSIIVPMYNEQENVEQCVNMLKKQINQNFDVCFIDDGSKDCTVEKLKFFLNENVHFNYKIMSQANQGAAAARKTGLDNAVTQFIMICDCDDKISDDLINEIYKTYELHRDVDIILPELMIQSENLSWQNLKFYTDESILKSRDCVKYSLDGWQVHGCYAIKKEIFQRSYEQYREFNSSNINYINNDEVITRINFFNAIKIIRMKSTYNYNYNYNSTTKRINDSKYLMINNVMILNDYFNEDEELSYRVKLEMISVLWGTFVYMHKYRSELKSLKEWDQKLKINVKSLDYVRLFSGLSLKKKVQLTILKLAYLF